MSLRLAIALAFVVTSAEARADIVVLINHVEYRGVIVSEDTDHIVMLSEGEKHKFFRDMVASLKYDKATADAERAGSKRREAAEMQQHPVKLTRTLASSERAGGAAVQADSSTGVTLYGTSWCGYCQRARAFLRHRNVPFADRDVEADADASREMQRKCASAGIRPGGVPVIDVFGSVMGGWNQARLDTLLKEHGY